MTMSAFNRHCAAAPVLLNFRSESFSPCASPQPIGAARATHSSHSRIGKPSNDSARLPSAISSMSISLAQRDRNLDHRWVQGRSA